MTKQEFIETFGEDPVDVLGQDYEQMYDITAADEADVAEWVRVERSDDGE